MREREEKEGSSPVSRQWKPEEFCFIRDLREVVAEVEGNLEVRFLPGER